MALCRTVNCETYCQQSWQIMRNLLGTDLGHAALLQMCNILNERALHTDAPLLRGAVFHINMGVWGSSSSAASTLRCTPSMVLLSFLYVSFLALRLMNQSLMLLLFPSIVPQKRPYDRHIRSHIEHPASHPKPGKGTFGANLGRHYRHLVCHRKK